MAIVMIASEFDGDSADSRACTLEEALRPE